MNSKGVCMSIFRIGITAALIALGPIFIVWLVTFIITDPDEGANIGAGLIGLVVVAISILAAIAYLARKLVSYLRSK